MPDDMTRYVILPTSGLRATNVTSTADVESFLRGLNAARTFTAAKAFAASMARPVTAKFKVLDSIAENGAKLVEMTNDTANDIKANQPGVRIVPEVFYKPARHEIEVVEKARPAAGGASVKTKITVVSTGSKATPVEGARVVAFTNFAAGEGAEGRTSATGIASLALGGAAKIERLYVYPPAGYWSGFRKNVPTAGGVTMKLHSVKLPFTDAVRKLYPPAALTDGAGVTVGIVDTGVGPHPDLAVAGGLNTVGFNQMTGQTEAATDHLDNGDGHGTHVAGLVASTAANLLGLAPGVTLRSYRVFGKSGGGGSNWSIAKAIDQAAADGCDLINLSLVLRSAAADPLVVEAIHHSRAKGCVVIAATGNDGRQPVKYPATDSLCLAVTALGVKGTFPRGTVDDAEIVKPLGKVDPKEFIAEFSNVGPPVDLTGPGVGVLSTLPNGGFGPMSGTSMAAPVVTGFAARLFASKHAAVLQRPRDLARSNDLSQILLLACVSRGFPAPLQGSGMPM